jgi:hypothetical protein
MSMTTKEILLMLSDKILGIEEQLEFQHNALHDLTESCTMIAEGLKIFINDFYGDGLDDDKQTPIPVAAPPDFIEKMNDPKYMRELANRFSQGIDELESLEEDLNKVKDEILTGEMGES